MYYSKLEFPVIAAHIQYAQWILHQPAVLHYLPFRDLQNKNRDEAYRSFMGDAPDGYSWDEYPFASTFEGGYGASVIPAPRDEQRKQGGKHNAFYTANRFVFGEAFRVEVTE